MDYEVILLNLLLIAVIAVILLVLNYFARQKSNKMLLDKAKLSSYECGFEPFSEMHSHSIDVQFFLVSIMFLIFDIELALMFPWAIHLEFLGLFSFWVMMIFLILLTVGFAYEWKKGALNWHTTPLAKKTDSVFPIFLLFLTPPPLFNPDFAEISTDEEYAFLEFHLNLSSGNSESFWHYYDWFFSEICLFIILIILLFVGLQAIKTQNSRLVALYVVEHVSTSLIALTALSLFTLACGDVLGITKLTFNGYFSSSESAVFFKTFIMFLSAIALRLSKNFVYNSVVSTWEYPVFIGLATVFMLLLISAHNFFSLFLCLEGLSLCLYILAAYEFARRTSSEAAIKYFTMGALSAGCLLFGIACVYGGLGSTDFIDSYYWLHTFSNANLFVAGIGGLFIVYGLLFKAGAWPLHQWVPDVYEGVAGNVTAFFATVVKFVVIVLIMKISLYVYVWNPVFYVVGLLSLFVGVFGALEANKIKRFLAYTAINQVGLLLIGIYVNAIFAVFFYLICYILTAMAFFIIYNNTRNLKNENNPELIFISDFNNFGYYNTNKAVLLVIILFAMAGLPPFVTAIGKWMILYQTACSNLFVLFFIMVCLTIFSIFYYVRLVRSLFFENELTKAKSQIFIYVDRTLFTNASLGIMVIFMSIGSFFTLYYYPIVNSTFLSSLG